MTLTQICATLQAGERIEISASEGVLTVRVLSSQSDRMGVDTKYHDQDKLQRARAHTVDVVSEGLIVSLMEVREQQMKARAGDRQS